MNTTSLNSPSRLHPWRHRFAWLLLVWLPFLSLTALGAQEGDFVFETDGAGAKLTFYTGPGGAVVIPDHLGGVPVTSFGSEAFSNRTNLTSVTIPNSVTFLGPAAFFGCTSLMSV